MIGFKIDDLSDVYCEVSWSQTPNAINYDLRYKSEPDTSWLYVNNLTDTVFTIAGLEIQEDYECQVRASGAGVETAWSDTLHFTTLIEAPCEGPKNVSAHNILMSSVDISWNDFRVAQFVNIRYRERGTSTWIESDSIDDEENHVGLRRQGVGRVDPFDPFLQEADQGGARERAPDIADAADDR